MKILAEYLSPFHASYDPSQIAEDLGRIQDARIAGILIHVGEEDTHDFSRYDPICAEAQRRGLAIYMVANFWAGLFHIEPLLPYRFTELHPACWQRDRQGRPLLNHSSKGIIGTQRGSIHFPKTMDYIQTCLDAAAKRWPIQGVFWTNYRRENDYATGPLYRARPPTGEITPENIDWHIEADIAFLQDLIKIASERQPGLQQVILQGVFETGDWVSRTSSLKKLDGFGCFGYPKVFDSHYSPNALSIQSDFGLIVRGDRYCALADSNMIQSVLLTQLNRCIDWYLTELSVWMDLLVSMTPDILVLPFRPLGDTISEPITEAMLKYLQKMP